MRKSRRLGCAMVAVGIGCLVAPAAGEHPALSRPLLGESFERDPVSIEALIETRGLAGGVMIGLFSRSLGPAVGDPFESGLEVGGRGEVGFITGRYRFGGDGTVDGRFNVDSREYPGRLYVGAVWPEFRFDLRAVAGFDQGEYGGTDLAMELAPIPIPVPGLAADFRPDLRSWLRGRKFEHFDEVIVNPAIGLVIDHLPLLASSLGLALTAQSDFARRNHPDSFGMVQVRWNSGSAPIATGGRDPDLPAGARHLLSGGLELGWFAHAAYAFPLDSRHYARIALGVGVRFVLPLDGRS